MRIRQNLVKECPDQEKSVRPKVWAARKSVVYPKISWDSCGSLKSSMGMGELFVRLGTPEKGCIGLVPSPSPAHVAPATLWKGLPHAVATCYTNCESGVHHV